MSIPKKITIKCSKCGTLINATMFESINTDYSSDVVEKIISGELFQARCEKCNTVHNLDTETLYHDVKNKAMVMILHPNSEEYEKRVEELRMSPRIYECTRIVSNVKELKEKVACLENGKDDRIIELCKVFAIGNLLSQQPNFKLKEAVYTINNRVYIYDESGEGVNCEIPDANYEYLRDLYYNSPYAEQKDERYAIVNHVWAEETMEKLLKMVYPELEQMSNDNASTEMSDDVLVCEKCHNELSKGSLYCNYCGNKVGSNLSLKSDESEPKVKSTSAVFREYPEERKEEKQQVAYITPTENNVSKKIKEFKMPSAGKSGAIIAILLFVCLSQTMHPYIESTVLYDYGIVFGLIDLALLSLITMTIPLIIGVVRTDLTPKQIKLISAINSIAIFLICLVLNILEVTSYSIGWIILLMYYFINKHILLRIHNEVTLIKIRNCRIAVTVIIVLLFIGVIAGGMYQASVINEIYDKEVNGTGSNDTETDEHHCRYVEYDYKEATCTVNGYRKFRCDACGATMSSTEEATGHYYDNNGVCSLCGIKKAGETETEDETDSGTSNNQGSTEEASKPQHTHKYEVVDSKEASCTEVGYTKYKCECGDEYQKTADMLEHNVSAGKCKTCGYVTFETMKFTGTGPSSIKNIDLPDGEYYIIGKHHGTSNFNADFYHSISDSFGDMIANKVGTCETIAAIKGPIENGYINVDMADGDWEFTIVACEAYEESGLSRTLTYEGTGAIVIPNINLPSGDYYITCYYYGEGNFSVDFYESVDDAFGNLIANEIGVSESVYGFSGPIKQGFIDIGMASGKWKIVIEPCD